MHVKYFSSSVSDTNIMNIELFEYSIVIAVETYNIYSEYNINDYYVEL